MGIYKPLPPQLQRAHPLARGLVGAWEFTEGAGLTAYDSSGYGNHGSFAGAAGLPVWGGGIAGSALVFDGTDKRVAVPNSPSLQFGTAGFSQAYWADMPSAANTYALVCGNLDDGSNGYSGFWCGFVGGYPTFDVRPTGSDNLAQLTTDMTGAGWHFYVAVRNASGAYLYMDAVQVASTTGSGVQGNLTSTTDFIIGRERLGDAGDNFKGSIDRVYTYNRALSAAEVAALYQMTGP